MSKTTDSKIIWKFETGDLSWLDDMLTEPPLPPGRRAEEIIGQRCRELWISFGTNSQIAWAARLAVTNPRHFMRKDDIAVFDALPERFTVYRSQNPVYPIGISWTKSKKIAEEFIDSCKNQNRILLTRVVTKAEIYAVIAGREREILILPARTSDK